MKHKFQGTGPALVTPFNEDKTIDFDSLKQLIAHVSPHVDYLVVLGTTGESVTLSAREKDAILEFVKAHNTRQLPIVYGLGGNNTTALLEQIHTMDFSEVDAILSVSPYYNKPSQEGIFQHYTAIADTCPVPVILYNVPGRTSSNISAATCLRLAEHPNIIGIKEASGNMEQCIDIARNKPADFLLISGDDMLTVPMISIGASGVISVLANAFPKVFCSMVNHALKGDFAAASKDLFALSYINPLMYAESNPVGVKAALAHLGVGNGEVRLPLVKASATLYGEIGSVIKTHLS
jgi:4-hydroxy-tetrahydrodipicolinate synthase